LPYHITQRGTNHEKVFFSAADRLMYLRLVRENMGEAGVRILAYCLMTNHVHLVVVPERLDSLALLFSRVHGRYSQYVNLRRQRSGHLWQARYYSCPMSDRHMWIALRYVEDNPCRAGIVPRPEAYRWSSAASHLLGAPDLSKILDLEFWEQAGGVVTWVDLHAAGERNDEVRVLRKCTYGGRPFGDEEFINQMESRFQRVWRRTGADLTAEIVKTA
jgi:putative transposase